MTNNVIEHRGIPLDLSESDVWSVLGTPDKSHPGLVDEVTELTVLAKQLVTPSGITKKLEVLNVGRGVVEFAGGLSIDGKFMAHLFEGATTAVFLVVTIGPALESKVEELMASGNNVEGVVLDAAGSAAAMNLLANLLKYIYEDASQNGLQVGSCCTPGQSFWNISGQGDIFDAVPADLIGVRLLESKFMIPRKSQSSVLPLGLNLKVAADPKESYCRYCPATNCSIRKEAHILI